MSKSKLRSETNCLNCGNEVMNRYCSHCGQENREPHESFWSLVFHFIEDITHFDGAFFRSTTMLFSKPGELTRAYLSGKRSSYLHPIRFYLFTSAFFFLTLFYIFQPLQYRWNKNLKTEKVVAFDLKVNDRGTNTPDLANQKAAQIDSLSANTNPFLHLIYSHYVELQKKYPDNKEFYIALFDGVTHKLSQVLFLTIPFVILIMQIIFFRRKDFYFMHHGIFVLHMGISWFLVLFVRNVFDIFQLLGLWGFWEALKSILMIAWIYFYYLSFKNFYQLKGVKAISLFTLATVYQGVVLLVAFLSLVLFSFFSM